MPPARFLSMTDQVTNVLREGLLHGRWRDVLPGRNRLARDLGVSHKTVEAAMRRLVKEGLLVSRGPGQRRGIMLPEGVPEPGRLRIRILPYGPEDRSHALCIDVLKRLNEAGYDAAFTTKSLKELGMDVKRVSRFVTKTPADAWIITACSREALEWFCAQTAPAFAMFGVKSGLPIAGVGVKKNMGHVIRHLASLGHRCIVLLTSIEHVQPKPALLAQSFLEEMKHEGIETSSYNLPAWGRKPEELHQCLGSLFKHTAPTALIIDESPIFLAVQDHLARRGIIAPRDISLQ
jgi:biotin operon repressor